MNDRLWTWPNALSFARLLGVPVFLWLVLVKFDWWALAILVFAGLSDWLDGKLARMLDQTSRIGTLLDPAADRLYILATLVGLLLSSVLGVQPVWIAIAGAAAITVPAVVRRTATPRALIRALDPAFLVFVLGLGVIVTAASDNGLASAVHTILPYGRSLPDLLGIAAVSAVLANLLNNLPAILILAPALAPAGHGLVLAALLGVNIGPNLTYVGSLATLLWRRILRAEDTKVNLGEFLRLGLATVPAALAASTLLLWSVLQTGI